MNIAIKMGLLKYTWACILSGADLPDTGITCGFHQKSVLRINKDRQS